MIRDDGPALPKVSFLTHDRTLHTIVRIDLDNREKIEAFPIGRELEKPYKRFTNRDGKSMFDRYKLKHRPDQDMDYHLEQFLALNRRPSR